MFTNRLNIINLFAMLMLSIALFLIAIGAQFYTELIRDNFEMDSMNRVELIFGSLFLSFGVFILILSLGLILRWKWVRIVFQVIFLLSIVAWGGLTYFLIRESQVEREGFIIIGIGIIGLGIFLYGLLFMSNAQVKRYFVGEDEGQAGAWEVLDRS